MPVYEQLRVLDVSGNDPSRASLDSLSQSDHLQTLRMVKPSSPPEGSILELLKGRSELLEINLQGSSQQGPVPDFFGELPLLKLFNLSHNSYSGSIPPSIYSVSNLECLDFGHNQLEGNVSCFTASALHTLVLCHNRLEGTIEEVVRHLSHSLKVLHLQFNEFFGAVPDLSAFPLVHLIACNNALTGMSNAVLPMSIKTVNLSHNSLTGPAGHAWLRCPNLERLNLQHNAVEGKLFPENTTAASWPQRLKVLDVSHNRLCGSLSSLHKLPLLERVDVSFNAFTGAIALRKADKLLEFAAESNHLTTTIEGIVASAPKLIKLNLANNALKPTKLRSFPSNFQSALEELDLRETCGASEFFADFTLFNSLRVVDLRNAFLANPLPPALFVGREVKLDGATIETTQALYTLHQRQNEVDNSVYDADVELKRSGSIWGVLITLFSAALIMVDVGTDWWNATRWLTEGHYWWGSLSIVFLYLHTLTTVLFTIGTRGCGRGRTQRVILCSQLLGLEGSIEMLLVTLGWRSRYASKFSVRRPFAAEETLLALEFLGRSTEDFPQVMLQMYIILSDYFDRGAPAAATLTEYLSTNYMVMIGLLSSLLSMTKSLIFVAFININEALKPMKSDSQDPSQNVNTASLHSKSPDTNCPIVVSPGTTRQLQQRMESFAALRRKADPPVIPLFLVVYAFYKVVELAVWVFGLSLFVYSIEVGPYVFFPVASATILSGLLLFLIVGCISSQCNAMNFVLALAFCLISFFYRPILGFLWPPMFQEMLSTIFGDMAEARNANSVQLGFVSLFACVISIFPLGDTAAIMGTLPVVLVWLFRILSGLSCCTSVPACLTMGRGESHKNMGWGDPVRVRRRRGRPCCCGMCVCFGRKSYEWAEVRFTKTAITQCCTIGCALSTAEQRRAARKGNTNPKKVAPLAANSSLHA